MKRVKHNTVIIFLKCMKRFVSVVLLLCVSVISHSQIYDDEVLTKEIGFSIGAMNCNTDIGGQVMDIQSFRPSGGIYAAVLYKQRIGLRLEGTVGEVTASDKRAYSRALKFRNLDFTSTIKEISLLAEIHPLNFTSSKGTTPALSPYLLIGVGYFGFDPRTKLDDRWVDLQPLHTEGEGFPETGRPNYKLSALNIPVGGGLRYRISDRLTLYGEAVYRVLTTDYLDDVSTTYIDPALFDKYLSPDNAVLARQLADRSYKIGGNSIPRPGSQRGSPKKDAYYSINLKLGIRLVKESGWRNGQVLRRSY